tara:strand:+ start:291 stop:773 length:483 start_codon:yes stop_codon:yes gene_type:complete
MFGILLLSLGVSAVGNYALNSEVIDYSSQVENRNSASQRVDNVVDGVKGLWRHGAWLSRWRDSNAYFVLDLGSEVNISKIRVYNWYGDKGVRNFKVSFSDYDDFGKADIEYGNLQRLNVRGVYNQFYEDFDIDVKGRYIKFEVLDNFGSRQSSLVEFEIY